MKSKVITLSAIAAAFVAICLTVGAYINLADVFALVLCSAFVVLPLYYKSVKGALGTYLAGGVLGLIFGNFNFLYTFIFPAYFVFFGLYPVIAFIMRKKTGKLLYHIVGAAWSVGFFYGLYFYYTRIMGLNFYDIPPDVAWLRDNILYFIWLVALAFYFIYERYVFVVNRITDRYLGKIIGKV